MTCDREAQRMASWSIQLDRDYTSSTHYHRTATLVGHWPSNYYRRRCIVPSWIDLRAGLRDSEVREDDICMPASWRRTSATTKPHIFSRPTSKTKPWRSSLLGACNGILDSSLEKRRLIRSRGKEPYKRRLFWAGTKVGMISELPNCRV